MADEAKAKGNRRFSVENYAEVFKNFTDSTIVDPTNPVCYSNRSAAYASAEQYHEALSDAIKTIELKPDWSEGYSRLGAAHLGLRQYKDAISAYKKALEIDPNNETLRCRLVDAYSASASCSRSRPAPDKGTFGPDMWQKLTADPTTQMYMRQPDFVRLMQELQRNPDSLKMMKDPRVTPALKVLWNTKDKEMPDSSPPEPEPESRLTELNDEEDEAGNTAHKKRAKRELEQQQEYYEYDPELADKEGEKGNVCFKEQKYPEAIKHYTESLQRNPKDLRGYCNRAACYTKLGSMAEGLKDAEKCIELDPTFTKGYTRKGVIQFIMKQYEKALETFQEGLKHDANNQELLQGVRICGEKIKGLRCDEVKERQFRGMQDPEILGILTDPAMGEVLKDLQENPEAGRDHMKNPLVRKKIQKLISSGIVQLK